MEIIDKSSLFKIAYGLYVITMNDGSRDNGMICNAVMQVTNEPLQVAVAINKANYSHEVIQKSGVMNVNVLSEAAPFSVFQNFGFRSGRDNDKFIDVPFTRSTNGLPVLSHDCNAFYSLKVENYIDLGTHGMFICSVTEAQTLSDLNTMTYTYYQENVKPKKPATKKKGWICKICGYVYEGDELPPDFICPLCKHPASDFERLDDTSATPAAPQPAAVEETESDAPKMQKYVCDICTAVYDPAVGDPEHGIPAGTPFEDLPDDWVCPICGVSKENFKPVKKVKKASDPATQKYICNICTAIYDPVVGDPEHGIPAGTPFEDIPDTWVCPICGVTKENFKPLEE